MKKVKYVYDGVDHWGYNLVVDKVYDVIEYVHHPVFNFRDTIVIEVGDLECTCFWFDGTNIQPLFEDVTLEYRGEIVDEILN